MSWSKRHHLKLKKLNGAGGGGQLMPLHHFWSHDSKAEFEDDSGSALHSDFTNQDFCLFMSSSQSYVWVFLLHMSLYQDYCPHKGYVPLWLCQKTKFLYESSVKNRIRFGLKLGCHCIPWAPLSTLSGENAGPFYAFCWMKGRTQILENIILFVFLDCWSFLVPLSNLPGSN